MGSPLVTRHCPSQFALGIDRGLVVITKAGVARTCFVGPRHSGVPKKAAELEMRLCASPRQFMKRHAAGVFAAHCRRIRKCSAAEPQPNRGTATLAVRVTGGTPAPQRRGAPRGRPEVGHADGGGQARCLPLRLCARIISQAGAHHVTDLLLGKGLCRYGGTRNVGPNGVRPWPSAAGPYVLLLP
jgi:hypothetical protein